MANKFFSNWIVKNILGAVAFVAVLVLGITILLSIYTHHGSRVTVPDFTNLTVEEAQAVADSSHLRVEVEDSVFVRRMKKGAVFSQNPKAGSEVKKGRRVMLITNAKVVQKVTMPNVVDRPVRTAKSELSAKGLYLGELRFVSYSDNNVIRQLHNGREIKPGKMIDSGSTIDLEVGLQDGDNQTHVPNVKGMKWMRAVDSVHDYSLNVRVVFDESVRNYSDSLNAVVYRQVPESSRSVTTMGSRVTVYLTVNPDRLPSK